MLMLFAPRADAQRVAGVGDDAIPIPQGGLRFRIAANWNRYDDVFRLQSGGNPGREPLLARLEVPSLGVNLLPQLSETQSAIGTLTGSDNYALTLGTLEARGEVQENITPIAVDYGVMRRLSLGVVIPYVEARTTTRFILNREGTGANVGQNPAYLPAGNSARVANGLVLRELATAQASLLGEVERCALPDAMGCDAILANPQGVQQLLTRASQVQTAIATVYGDSVFGGSVVAPIAGSATHATVAATLATLRTEFTNFGIDAIGENSVPVGATTVLGQGGFSRLLGDNVFGPGYSSLGNRRKSGIGDVDLTGTFLLFDSFKANQAQRFSPNGTKLRTAVTAGWRFGTATSRRMDDPFDLPTGEGVNALLFRSTTDLMAGRWFWISASARAVKPMKDNIAIAVPIRNDSTVFDPFTVVEAERSLGTRFQLEVAPRAAVGEFFGLSAAYQLQRLGDDNYSMATDAGNANAIVPSRSLHLLTLGVTYSSLASFSRGRSRLPVEVIYSHSEPIAAGGGSIPAVATDRLELRVYAGFPRR